MISAINLLSIFNLFALAVLIALSKQNIIANRILGLTLICSATDFVINLLSYNSLLDDFPYVLFLNFSFLWAPLVALYVILMLEIKWKFGAKNLVHLIPLLLSWSYWGYVFFSGENFLNEVLQNRQKGIYPWQLQAFQIVIILQAIFYLGYSVWLIRKKQGDNNFARLPQMRFQWLKQFVFVLIALIFLLIVFSFLVEPVTIDYIITPILYGISNIFLVYKGLNSSGILTDVAKERYTGSNLKPDHLMAYKEHLLMYLKAHEPYTDPELTLNDLAKQTDIQPHHLSQVINQLLDKNFFDLINSYRIEKSKTLITDSNNDNFTLEAIGLTSGFGSASSFYRSFKKHTGITPKAFLKGQSTADL